MATLIQNGKQIGFGIESSSFSGQKTRGSALGKSKNLEAIEKYIVQRLAAVQLPSQQRANKDQKDYSVWGVERNLSLITKDKIGCYGVELVSPVLFDDWPNTLEQVIGIITDAFTIVEDSSAGTHVHVAPLGRTWSDPEFKQISKGIVAWSASFEQLMPRSSRNEYARWNKEQWPNINQQDSIVMSIDRLSREEIKSTISGTRYFAWNLTPKNTIEFRRPYQTLSCKEALHWVVLTLSLVSFFLRNGEQQVPQQDNIKAVREIIRKEANKLHLALYLNFNFCN